MNDLVIVNPKDIPISEEKLKNLVEIINAIYLASEGELWPHDGSYFRITLSEIKDFIKKGHLRFAMIADKIVGVIKIHRKEDNLGCFGLLSVDPNYRNLKIGSKLIQIAEQWCVSSGLSCIELELLVPREFSLKDKEMLRKWYSQIGYKLIAIEPFESLYPSHKDLIQVPCNFEIMRKSLF